MIVVAQCPSRDVFNDLSENVEAKVGVAALTANRVGRFHVRHVCRELLEYWWQRAWIVKQQPTVVQQQVADGSILLAPVLEQWKVLRDFILQTYKFRLVEGEDRSCRPHCLGEGSYVPQSVVPDELLVHIRPIRERPISILEYC